MKLFPVNLVVNEAANSYLELPVTAAVPSSCCNLKILTLFTTHLFCWRFRRECLSICHFHLIPTHIHIPRQQKFSALSTVFLLLGEGYVIKPSWLSDWGNYLSSSQFSVVGKDTYKNKLVFNVLTSNCNSVCKIN